MDNSSYLIGRQPILNAQEETVAYELLFRSSASIFSAAVENATQASSQVIFNTLSGFGIQDILGRHRGFINVDIDLLMSDAIEIIPPQMIGIELLESIRVTPAVVDRCRYLKSRGCLLVLDDHRYDPAYAGLYDGVVDIVKVDLAVTPPGNLPVTAELLKHYPLRLLAEKVDTRTAYLRCRGMGFELFQGFFFARPSLIRKQRMESCAATFIKLLQKLTADTDITEIEQIFKESPALTYKLLMLVNSVSFGIREKIRTVRHAITLIGMQQLKRWVQIAIFAAEDSQAMDTPLMEMAASRAAFMEEMARCSPRTGHFGCIPDQAFLVGILSLLQDTYDISLTDIVEGLNLSDDIRDALLNRGGELGELLHLTELIEQGKLEQAMELLGQWDIPTASVLECQKKAFCWQQGLL
jgi:EAL and modified HD-GYP domain-containing signal transduction protein